MSRLMTWVLSGKVHLNLGVGRRTRPLGPIVIEVAAPQDQVYAAAAAPYAPRPTRAMRAKVEVLSRTGNELVAAHKTPVNAELTAITIEKVRLFVPDRIEFELVRGPVPHVVEEFRFEALGPQHTRLTYTGELGTDCWRLGQRWGEVVAKSWEAAVADSMATIQKAVSGNQN